MPVLASSTSSPRRLGGTSSYTSSYSRSYGLGSGVRTSSLDRSPYTSSYVSSTSSYKYTSPSSRDYSSRPPISTRTATLYSTSTSTRTSPARSYFSTRQSTSEDGPSRTRDSDTSTSNNNYLNGNIRRYTTSTSATLSSKYRTDKTSLSNGSAPTPSKYYSSERDDLPKISERMRNFQPKTETPTYKSRFLRSSPTPDAKEEPEERPSVSDLRRRYDLNRNHVTPERSRTPTLAGKPPTGVVKSRTAPGSDSDEDGSATPVTHQRLSSATPDLVVGSNGADKPSRPSVPKEAPRSTSPSTLSSSSSDSETQDGTQRQSTKLETLPSSRSRPQQPKQHSDNAGLVGLRNIGNTCFMNSVLQCLSNTRAVLEYVISDEYVNHVNTSVSSMHGDLIKAFAIVLAELWKKDDDDDDGYTMAVNPTALKSQIQKFAPRFMGYNQQDAQEFLRYLLEGLHEDVNRIAVKPRPIDHDISDSLSDAEKAIESWKRYLRRDDSKIVDLFVGQLKSTLQCTVCGHCSVTFDPFWDLSLPIPPSGRSNTKLQQCLELFAKEEILDGDEKPTCAKCQTRRKCTKKFTIHKFPQLLVLHLKRFSPGERFRKLDASVDFPLTDLDLTAYTSPNVRPSPCSYQLYGVINHSGSAYSGHYTASCRHPFSGTWHEYNDSRVNSLSAQRVASSEAYLLFYELETHGARL